MTKKKSTKRALISSLLVLAMCFTMLAGTTFAWFTDSVVSGNNRIIAGNLDIDLVMWNGTAYESIADGQGDIFGAFNSTVAQNVSNDTLWEPGKTQVVFLGVENLGTLWARYRIYIDVTDNGLADQLDFAYIDGAKGGQVDLSNMNWAAVKALAEGQGADHVGTLAAGRITAANLGSLEPNAEGDFFALAIHMKEEAGNQYQGKEAIIDIAVVATQDDVEYDSFDNTYDYNVDLPQVAAPVYVSASNAAEFTAAITNAADGTVITLTDDVELTAPLTISSDVTIQGDGNTLITEKPITAAADVTIKDVNFADPDNAAHNASMVYASNGSEEIVFDGCVFSNPQWEVVQVTTTSFKKLSITNCTFNANEVHGATSSYGNQPDECIRYIHVETPSTVNDVEIVITGNTFNNCDKVKDSIVGIYFVEGNITIGGNTFNDLVVDGNGKSALLSVHWPENEALKEVALWTGAEYTTTIAAA